jgi:hypothetical protein
MTRPLLPSEEAYEAATEFIDKCIATAVEYGGRPPSDDRRMEAIVEVAKVTERWIQIAKRAR